MINTTGGTHLWHRFFKMTQSSLIIHTYAKYKIYKNKVKLKIMIFH